MLLDVAFTRVLRTEYPYEYPNELAPEWLAGGVPHQSPKSHFGAVDLTWPFCSRGPRPESYLAVLLPGTEAREFEGGRQEQRFDTHTGITHLKFDT